jgi:hypothetical protein
VDGKETQLYAAAGLHHSGDSTAGTKELLCCDWLLSKQRTNQSASIYKPILAFIAPELLFL